MTPAECRAQLSAVLALLIAAATTFAGTLTALAIAIVLNAGFFTALAAPGAVAAAIAASLLTVTLLSLANESLQKLRKDCIPSECDSKFTALTQIVEWARNLTMGAFAVLIIATLPAGIPWYGLVVLAFAAIVCAGVLLLLLQLPSRWTALNECIGAVSKRAGGLQVGESLSDPWFLRLKPVDGVRYALPVEGSTAVVKKDVINDLFLRCSEISVGQWEIRALASLTGPPGVGANFEWFLDGKSLGAGSVDAEKRASTLISKVPVSPKESLTLLVQAKDKGGFTSKKQTDIALPATYLACKATVALLTPERKSPATPIDGEIFRPAIAILHESADEIVRKKRTSGGRPIA